MDPLIVRLPSSGVLGTNNPVFLNRGVEADDFVDDELLSQDTVDETLDTSDVALFMILLLLNFSSQSNGFSAEKVFSESEDSVFLLSSSVVVVGSDALGVVKVDEILKSSLLLLLLLLRFTSPSVCVIEALDDELFDCSDNVVRVMLLSL